MTDPATTLQTGTTPCVRDGTKLVRRGELLPSEWLDQTMAAVDLWETKVHAWEMIDLERAYANAKALDRVDWSTRKVTPLLAGVPLGVKDIINTIDHPTQRGSDYWKGYTAHNDARVVASAKWAGAQVMGKTTTAEFAVHTAPKTNNPHDETRTAGTSSTGSAVAVACGMVPIALGTQSAGSIIRPASYVGVLGYKPSFGLIPRTGVLKTCDTLDTVGWFARCVDDLGIALDALRVHGRNHPNIERGFAAERDRRRQTGKWRVAFAKAPGWDLAHGYARTAIEKYARELGKDSDIEVVDVDLRELFADVQSVHRTIYHKSLAYYFRRELLRPEGISPAFREIVDEGNGIPLDTFEAALSRQDEFEKLLSETLNGFDALMTLSVAGEAPHRQTESEVQDSALTWTLSRAASLTLPLFSGPSELPFGLQLVAPRYHDYRLLDFARRLLPGTLPTLVPKAGNSEIQ